MSRPQFPGLGMNAARERVAARWSALRPQERRVVGWGLIALAGVLVWSLALKPAWRVLDQAPTALAQLDGELQAMRALAAEASELRAVPPLRAEAAHAALDRASAALGDKLRLRASGDRVTATFAGVGASEMRRWLQEARAGARARIVEVDLTRDDGRFNGRVELTLPTGTAP